MRYYWDILKQWAQILACNLSAVYVEGIPAGGCKFWCFLIGLWMTSISSVIMLDLERISSACASPASCRDRDWMEVHNTKQGRSNKPCLTIGQKHNFRGWNGVQSPKLSLLKPATWFHCPCLPRPVSDQQALADARARNEVLSFHRNRFWLLNHQEMV